MEEVLLYGFGGHGKVVAELLLKSDVKWIGVFYDNFISSTYSSIEHLGIYNS